MSITIAIFIGLSLTIIFLFLYIFARDKEIDKKFQMLSVSLENINQEIYNLQKHQKDMNVNIDSKISEQLNTILESVAIKIEENRRFSQTEISQLVDKIHKLESNMKALSLPNISNVEIKKDNREKIRELYEIGYSIEEIAKELSMSAGEVSFLLKNYNNLA